VLHRVRRGVQSNHFQSSQMRFLLGINFPSI
jgi:hypothetical protein